MTGKHFIIVRRQCPKCNMNNYDIGIIDPKTGICNNKECGFNIGARSWDGYNRRKVARAN